MRGSGRRPRPAQLRSSEQIEAWTRVGGLGAAWSGRMLILSRKPGDAILIDGNIRIVVLAADSGGVRLGIEAPSSVGIVREELVNDPGRPAASEPEAGA